MKTDPCPKCGGEKIIPGVPLLDRAHNNHEWSFSAIIVEKPDALVFTQSRRFKIRAWVCAACGYMELYVEDPVGLAESYQRFLDER